MLGTRYKFRHYTRHPDLGVSVLAWASDGPGGSILPRTDELIIKGSTLDLEVAESQLWTPNALADEGELDILDVYFDDQAVRSSLWFRLYNDTPAETDTLATLTGEVTGTGYAGIEVVRGTDWGAPALDSGDGKTTSTTKTYTAGGSWTAATQLVLATVASGTAGLFIAWAALSATRTLVNLDELDVSMGVKLA